MARMPVRRGLRPAWQAGGGPCGPCGGCPSGAGRHPCDAERVALRATACGETCRWLSPSGSSPAHPAGAGAWRGLARGVRDGNDWLRRSPRRRPGLPITSSPANRPEAHIRTRAQEPKILEILIPSTEVMSSGSDRVHPSRPASQPSPEVSTRAQRTKPAEESGPPG